LSPKFIVCDEPVSALDVSIQAQILNLLQDLQEDQKLTYLFISHNLAVVKHLSTRVIVMYLGQFVESAPTDELFENPVHPYTQALLDAVPLPVLQKVKERIILVGDVPTPINPLPGCRFYNRCRFACDACKEFKVELEDIGNNHLVACARIREGILKSQVKI
jgi:oligopeptide/dipeptide ABC transporter ATP-binding protein